MNGKHGSALAGVLVAAMLLLPTAGAAQEAPLPTNAELAAMLKFWSLDRLLIDQSEPVVLSPTLDSNVLAKAQPDQCYLGLDTPATNASPGPVPCTQGIEKTNQAYVWGLTQSNGYLYFGTIANTHCLVSEGYLDFTMAMDNPYWVCGFNNPTNAPYGSDWRPPRLFRYKLPSGPLEELSAKANLGLATDPKLLNTTGIRSAGSYNGVVFFAGPILRGLGINVFAFDGATGNLLAKALLTKYTDIRQWLVHDGVLYTTVGKVGGGEVLRWRGDASDPIKFEEVGDLDGAGAYLVVHEGRMYISTWPTGGLAGIVRGPAMPAGGLSAAEKPAANWVKIWDIGMYDPDPVVARTVGGGALASFRGDLYWGTMSVPFLGTFAATRVYCPEDGVHPCLLDANGNGAFDDDEFLATALGGHRSVALFRARHPEADKVKVDLVYGEYYLPKFDAAKKSYTIAYDDAHMNRMKVPPQFGASGFGNFWNAYLWTMSVFDGRLYVGTFDWSELVRVELQSVAGLPVPMEPRRHLLLEKLLGSNFPIIEGADVFHIDSSGGKAWGESYDGMGNFTNYGIRTVVVDPDTDKMYLGSANPMNLHPLGGWELIETTPKAKPKR